MLILKFAFKIVGCLIFATIVSSIFLFMLDNECVASDVKYKALSMPDGGYALEIEITKTNIFSADGFFQTISEPYEIIIIGHGKDWSYRNQKGYYYGLTEIVSNKKRWDIGYAWVDIDRHYLYLNLFWVSSPDGIRPSDVNGKYDLSGNP